MNDTDPKKGEPERKGPVPRGPAAELTAESAVLLDHAPVVTVVVDRDRRVRRVNRAGVAYTGRAAEEMINRRGGEALRCLHALDDPNGCGYGPACLNCPVRLAVVETFDTGRGQYQVPAGLPVARGEEREERELLITTSLLEPDRAVVYLEDITEHRRAVAALGEAQAYARSLIDSSPSMIISVGPERQIVEFNPAAEAAFGYDRGEVVGQPVDLLYADPDQGVEINRVVREEDRFVGEIRNRRRNGQVFPARLSAAALRDEEGALLGVMGISEDLSEQERLQAERHQTQRYELIGQLAAGVAHEINNPLTLVLGYARLLLKLDLDPQVRSRLETIHEGGVRAAAIADRLLAFARRQQGVKQPQELNSLVREAVELVRYPFAAHQVELAEDLAADLPLVEVDAGQIQQVLLGLLQNCQEALVRAGRGGVVQVRTRGAPERVLLEVEDDGPGIPPEVRERMFDPFYTTKEVGQGPGLGLSMCLGIAREHGGDLRCEPAATGARLVLELPAVPRVPSGSEAAREETGRGS